MKYGRQLLPQSIYDDPFARQHHPTMDDNHHDQPTPPHENTMQADHEHTTGIPQDTHHTSQTGQDPDTPKSKTWMENDPMKGI
eukprot:7547150-Heterocapsa_arctica.AAC.1